jgi:hypothetical protein
MPVVVLEQEEKEKKLEKVSIPNDQWELGAAFQIRGIVSAAQ